MVDALPSRPHPTAPERPVRDPAVPVLTVAHTRAFGLVAMPAPSLDELERLVASDGALTERVLRMANSALSAPVKPVTSVRSALVRIGVQDARRVVLTTALRGAFSDLGRAGIDVDELWRHLVACSVISDALASDAESEAALDAAARPMAFAAGLLHDVGRLAMAAEEPGRYASVVARVRQGECGTIEAEQRVFGFGHHDWGARVARGWGFPEPVVEVIERHHDAVDGLPGVVARARRAAARLGVGDGVSGPLELAPDDDPRADAMAQISRGITQRWLEATC